MNERPWSQFERTVRASLPVTVEFGGDGDGGIELQRVWIGEAEITAQLDDAEIANLYTALLEHWEAELDTYPRLRLRYGVRP